MPTFQDVLEAKKRVAGLIHRTPVVQNESINRRVDCQIYFKCDNLQKTGSFKIRGAVNALAQLTQDELKRGVITHSSGNHAAALAYAARLFGAEAHIVMPSNSLRTKMDAVNNYGGRIIECEPNLASRETVAAEIQLKTGAILIPPFDHPHIIAGQGTCALELLEDVPDLDLLVCPIGGGGLMSGTCLAVKGLSPSTRIIGIEPAGADDALRSKRAGKFLPQTNPQTIADGLRTSLGELTWPFIRDSVDQIFSVDDGEIMDARKYFIQRTKLLIEPSAAVGVAFVFKYLQALASGDFESLSVDPLPDFIAAKPRKIGVILCGGNSDL